MTRTASENLRVVITGVGVRTANARDQVEFAEALRAGHSGIHLRADGATAATRLGAWLSEADASTEFTGPRADLARSILRGAPRFTQAACAVAVEAFDQAWGAAEPDAEATALVVAGSNLQQNVLADHYRHFADRLRYVPPRFAVNFLDTHFVGAISELLGLRGPGFTVGAAAASGNAALYQGVQLLRAGGASACVCLAPVCDLSEFELQAFANLGAMHPGVGDDPPERLCRPFDRRRQGFVFGQACGALVLETLEQARRRDAPILAELAGVSLTLDGHHSTEPNADGEARAMRRALRDAGVEPAAVDYLNAHGTATAAGDDAECQAIRQVFGGHSPRINATKALCGHAFSAAGIVEVIATVLQMWHGFVHPNPNLDEPIDKDLRFVGKQAEPAVTRCALSNSFGFGGINSSVVLQTFDG